MWENIVCCFKVNISVVPAEEFTNLIYNNEEDSVCASDIYEKESGVFKYVPFDVKTLSLIV